ncbi:hypothetical protein MVEN_00874000 [Mycena venus]|uniref:Uncharacterized protein n=1 Tax=Mycena venus TaxID=2733690 RepID=A0A8H6YH86_9AGAR|nr:hypothetical protein MVEN_00874000 [Mycena venus]
MFATPIPSFASSIMRTHASASPDLTKTEPLLTWHNPSVCTRAAYAINEPFPPQLCANDATNTVAIICTFAQRDGSCTWNSPPRVQCRSIRKNREHSLRVKSPSLQYRIDITHKKLSRETTVPPPRPSSNIPSSRRRRPPLICQLRSSLAPTSPLENDDPGHAGSAFARGARVSYDARDFPLEAGGDARMGGKLPRLSFMEEVLSLGIKDKQGYLSFWNDNIIYALRGCILIELALRRRIGVVRDPGRALKNRSPLPDRSITVISTRQTGETLLDETLKMMKQTEDAGEKMGVGTWVDLLSGTCFISLSFPSYFLLAVHFAALHLAGVTSSSGRPQGRPYPRLIYLLSFSLRCWLFGWALGSHDRQRRTCPLPAVLAVTVFVAVLLPTSLALYRVVCCVWACKQHPSRYLWAGKYCWHRRLLGHEEAPASRSIWATHGLAHDAVALSGTYFSAFRPTILSPGFDANIQFYFLVGETWNVLKIDIQLKQVRERLAKGLVDKGVLRTEKRNFLLFDMATHPVVRRPSFFCTRIPRRGGLRGRLDLMGAFFWYPQPRGAIRLSADA